MLVACLISKIERFDSASRYQLTSHSWKQENQTARKKRAQYKQSVLRRTRYAVSRETSSSVRITLMRRCGQVRLRSTKRCKILGNGVIGNTPDFESGESRFDP